MNTTKPSWSGFTTISAGLVAIVLTLPGPSVAESHERSAVPSVSVFVNSGLNNPRGLHFGPDRYLYVAEGGTANSVSGC